MVENGDWIIYKLMPDILVGTINSPWREAIEGNEGKAVKVIDVNEFRIKFLDIKGNGWWGLHNDYIDSIKILDKLLYERPKTKNRR